MRRQLSRYAIVGITSNVVLYLGYLLLTSLGMGHKTAMTLLYTTGILLTFMLNRGWTFGFRGRSSTAFVRYVAIYLLGYVVNFSGLYVFVDTLGYPHEFVQAVLILVVALLMFILQKFWVFGREHGEVGNYGT